MESWIIYLSLLRVWAIRVTTKPSTAKCDLETYTLFLLAESKYPGCTRLADIMEDLSHDSVNRFLLRERYEPRDLFDEIKAHINLVDGTLSADDTVIDKFMVRTSEAIKTHFFSAIRAFTQLELMRTEELIENWYEVQRNLSLQVARDFILEHLEQRVGLNTHSQIPVNA